MPEQAEQETHVVDHDVWLVAVLRHHLRPRKLDCVLAVWYWVGFGLALGSKKNRWKNPKIDFSCVWGSNWQHNHCQSNP